MQCNLALKNRIIFKICKTLWYIIKVSTIVGNESNDIVSDLESLVKDVDSGGVVTIRISAAFKFKKDLVVTVILTNGKNRISISRKKGLRC